ncbi:hypothetical protein HDU89_004635 [Geranomyces variabilis]|nr:hypothetical protein HDU89_004635 [Geranomyces variabilis]
MFLMESKDQLWSERKRVLDLVNCQSKTSRIQSQTAATLASEVFHRKRTASPAADAFKDKRQNTSERPAELDAADNSDDNTVVSEFEAEDSVSHVLTEPDLEAHNLTVLFIKLHTGHSFERNMKKYAMYALAYKGPVEGMAPFDVLLVIRSLANGSSQRSKDHRAAYRQKPCGKKPDGRVLSNKSEQIFLETKSSKYADSAGQTLYDLFKLAQFCQGAINFKSKQKFQNFPCYGIQFLRDTIEIYQMDLSYDDIYTMVNLASCRVPRRLDDFCLLPPLIAAMLHIKIARSANDRRNLQHMLRIAARILGTKRKGAVHISALDRDRNM